MTKLLSSFNCLATIPKRIFSISSLFSQFQVYRQNSNFHYILDPRIHRKDSTQCPRISLLANSGYRRLTFDPACTFPPVRNSIFKLSFSQQLRFPNNTTQMPYWVTVEHIYILILFIKTECALWERDDAKTRVAVVLGFFFPELKWTIPWKVVLLHVASL